jgi:hypothetical protein
MNKQRRLPLVLGECNKETRRMSRRKTKLEIRALNLRVE